MIVSGTRFPTIGNPPATELLVDNIDDLDDLGELARLPLGPHAPVRHRNLERAGLPGAQLHAHLPQSQKERARGEELEKKNSKGMKKKQETKKEKAKRELIFKWKTEKNIKGALLLLGSPPPSSPPPHIRFSPIIFFLPCFLASVLSLPYLGVKGRCTNGEP